MKIGFSIAIGITALLLWGCSGSSKVLEDQRTAIERYLDGKALPYVLQSGVYKHLGNAGREGYEDDPVVKTGDSLKFDFAAYFFSSSTGLGRLYYTNIASIIEADTILNPIYWPAAPLEAKLGVTPLIAGLTLGLPDSRQGDSVLLFFASDLGYGGKPNGIIPDNTALVWVIKINEVIKQPN